MFALKTGQGRDNIRGLRRAGAVPRMLYISTNTFEILAKKSPKYRGNHDVFYQNFREQSFVVLSCNTPPDYTGILQNYDFKQKRSHKL